MAIDKKPRLLALIYYIIFGLVFIMIYFFFLIDESELNFLPSLVFIALLNCITGLCFFGVGSPSETGGAYILGVIFLAISSLLYASYLFAYIPILNLISAYIIFYVLYPKIGASKKARSREKVKKVQLKIERQEQERRERLIRERREQEREKRLIRERQEQEQRERLRKQQLEKEKQEQVRMERLKREQLEKERREKELEKAKKIKEEAELNGIPNLQELIRKFVYNQFRGIEKSLSNITSTQVDSFVRKALKNKIPKFFDAMETFEYKFTQYQQDLLFKWIFSESEAIRRDLFNLLKGREEEERIKREREEAKRKLEEQRRATAEAFGEEITSIELVEKVEQLKTIDEDIDDLLKAYEAWEHNGKKNKSS